MVLVSRCLSPRPLFCFESNRFLTIEALRGIRRHDSGVRLRAFLFACSLFLPSLSFPFVPYPFYIGRKEGEKNKKTKNNNGGGIMKIENLSLCAFIHCGMLWPVLGSLSK